MTGFDSIYDMAMFLLERPHLNRDEQMAALVERWPDRPTLIYELGIEAIADAEINYTRAEKIRRARANIRIVGSEGETDI